LGYLSEAATWRNAYLYGAHELRHGPPNQMPRAPVPPEALRAISLDAYFDFWGVRLNGPRAEGLHIVLNWSFIDTGQVYVLNLENAALTHRSGTPAEGAHATVTLTRKTLDSITLFESTFEKEIAAGTIRIEGDHTKVDTLLGLLDTFDSKFAIVEP
ncbi:MAG: MBL fold metallo-hydrolase, partial [Proteobacteria bacterium]